jgi:hypothetical protein
MGTCIRPAWVFTEPVVALIKSMAGTSTAAEIAAATGLNKKSIQSWASNHQVRLIWPQYRVYSPELVARIKALIGTRTMREIAAEVGVTLRSLINWGVRNGVKFGRLPVKDTPAATYDRLTKIAAHNGLKVSMRRGKVSVWVCVERGMSLAEAEGFMHHRNRWLAVEEAYRRGGHTRRTGNGRTRI